MTTAMGPWGMQDFPGATHLSPVRCVGSQGCLCTRHDTDLPYQATCTLHLSTPEGASRSHTDVTAVKPACSPHMSSTPPGMLQHPHARLRHQRCTSGGARSASRLLVQHTQGRHLMHTHTRVHPPAKPWPGAGVDVGGPARPFPSGSSSLSRMSQPARLSKPAGSCMAPGAAALAGRGKAALTLATRSARSLCDLPPLQ